ncbi:MAG: PaaI family thioesterase [Bacteroidota bacterium]
MDQSKEAHYRKLERMYLNSKGNQAYYDTITLQVSDRRAELGLDISEKYFHALGAIHGSVYFKLLDDAAFFAVNSIVHDFFVLTTSFNINLIRPASAGRLRAVGTVRFTSRQLFTAESTLYNEAGQEIAFGTGNFAKSKVALTEEIGYY